MHYQSRRNINLPTLSFVTLSLFPLLSGIVQVTRPPLFETSTVYHAFLILFCLWGLNLSIHTSAHMKVASWYRNFCCAARQWHLNKMCKAGMMSGSSAAHPLAVLLHSPPVLGKQVA